MQAPRMKVEATMMFDERVEKVNEEVDSQTGGEMDDTLRG